MRYNFIGKNIEVGEKTKEKVSAKLARIDKFFTEETVATVTLSSEKLGTNIEVTIPYHKRMIRAEVRDADMMAAVDEAIDIL